MKVFVAIATVAACLVATYSLPAPRAIDWTAVASTVEAIANGVGVNFAEMRAVANSDNPTVGSSISSKLDSAGEDANAILNKANKSIENQSLNVTEAETHVSSLKRTIAITKGSLTNDLALLTPEASSNVTLLFDATFDLIDLKAEELYLMLNQTVNSTLYF